MSSETLTQNPLHNKPLHTHPTRGLRPYFSDVSLAPSFSPSASLSKPLNTAQSDSLLSQKHSSTASLFSDLDDPTPHTYSELLLAAETLENIVTEGVLVGATVRRFKGFGSGIKDSENDGKESGGGKEGMNERVLKLVYGTMKYMQYIDTILVKTQFLVYNNQFLNHLGLTKVTLYDLMKHHFDFHAWPGIQYPSPPDSSPLSPSDSERIETVKELETALHEFKIKLAAAYARIRIERRASGGDAKEWMERILPEEVRVKEGIAVELPKHARVNIAKTTREGVAQALRGMGYPVELRQRKMSVQDESIIHLDENFDDVFVVPAQFCNDLKGTPLVEEGKLVFQDKASIWAAYHLAPLLSPNCQIIDARAGCGTKTAQVSSLMRNKGIIYAFENRPSRLETLKSHLKAQDCQNVEILESDFLASDPADPKFADVTVVMVEPPNSGTAILDKLNYLLQEEEFPNDQYSQRDLIALKTQQSALLRHALSFPNVQTVAYITRSTHTEENEQVVEETLDRLGGQWELACVLPDVAIPRSGEYEF
ncbi:hypothetical protein HK097_004417, partial [Rhizophlyctis rosea]